MDEKIAQEMELHLFRGSAEASRVPAPLAKSLAAYPSDRLIYTAEGRVVPPSICNYLADRGSELAPEDLALVREWLAWVSL